MSFNGEQISGRAGLIANIRDHAPGDEVTLGVRRDGALLTVRATLDERPAE